MREDGIYCISFFKKCRRSKKNLSMVTTAAVSSQLGSEKSKMQSYERTVADELAYLDEHRNILEDALTNALDEVANAKPKDPLHFLADRIARQAIPNGTGMAALDSMKLQEKVSTLEAKVAELEGQLKTTGQANGALQVSTPRRTRHTMNADVRSSDETVVHEDLVREVMRGADHELWTYLMKQFNHDVEVGGLEEEQAMPPGTSPSLRRTLDRMRTRKLDDLPGDQGERRASRDGKLGEEALRLTSKLHLPAEPTSKDLQFVLGVAMQVDVCAWDADVLGLCAYLRYPMAFVVELILHKYDAAATLGCSEEDLKAMLVELDVGYREANPYHNSTHAADVAYTLHMLLERGARERLRLSNMQLIGCVIAAAAHDFRHPGTTNQYLIAIQDPLAIRYNDRAVLESMHCSEFFEMLSISKSHLNVFSNMPRQQQLEMRKSVVAMILMTDMAAHFDALARFQASS